MAKWSAGKQKILYLSTGKNLDTQTTHTVCTHTCSLYKLIKVSFSIVGKAVAKMRAMG